ncbi:MAG: AEC family transporter [Anaerovoracaceae bacterium]
MLLDNLVISVEAVTPMFIVMTVGVLLRRKGIINEQEAKKVNRMIFVALFPALMFSNLYGKELSDAFNPRLAAFAVIMLMFIYFATMAVVLNIEKNPKSRGTMIQAIYRSNFVIMGIPIVSNIFGSENLAMTSMMITIIVPIFNVLAVVTLEIFRGGQPNPLHVITGIIKNPMIIGAVMGMLAVAFNIKLPHFAENTVGMLADAATPMALLILGASFDIKSVEHVKRNLIICMAGRLVVVPLIALTCGVIAGFRDVALVTLVAIFAAPTAVSSFTMAQQMDSDGELAGACVIFSSMFSCLTMFCWIFILKSLGMF